MTYDEEKKRLGREPVWIVELHLDYCSLIYGAAPCTAAIGTTGADKCYNTNKTCQDKTNYTKTTKVYRFSNVILPPSGDLEFQTINCVDNVDFLPSKIEPGKGIGKRFIPSRSLRKDSGNRTKMSNRRSPSNSVPASRPPIAVATVS